MTPFEVVTLLNEKKDHEKEEVLLGYNPWVINIALSNHRETVFFANEMNKYYDLTKEQQYNFYWHGIPKGKRFGKWNRKSESSEMINILMDFYCINRRTAEQYLSLMTDDEQEKLLKKTMRGGNYDRSRSKT